MNFIDWLETHPVPRRILVAPPIVAIVALGLFVSINEHGTDLTKWPIGAYTAAVAIASYLILIAYVIRPGKRVPAEQLAHRFKNLQEDLERLVHIDESPTPAQLFERRKYAVFKVQLFQELNWVDYFYLKVLRKLHEDLEFTPLILVCDLAQAPPHTPASSAAVEQLKSTLQLHLGRHYQLRMMSQVQSKLSVVGSRLLLSAAETVKKLFSGYETFIGQGAGSPQIEDVAFRCGRGIFWSIVLHDLAESSGYMLVCRWDTTPALFTSLPTDNTAYLKVTDFKLADRNGRLGKPGRALIISPTTPDRTGFEGIRSWALSQRESDTGHSDLKTVCRALRGCYDLDKDFNHLDQHLWPKGRWEAFAKYFPQARPKTAAAFDRENTWLKCLYLLTTEFQRIDAEYAALFWVRPMDSRNVAN